MANGSTPIKRLTPAGGPRPASGEGSRRRLARAVERVEVAAAVVGELLPRLREAVTRDTDPLAGPLPIELLAALDGR